MSDSGDRPVGRSVRARLLACGLSVVVIASTPAALPIVAQGPSDAELLDRIDALATREARADLLSGVMLVARGDRILLQRAYGFASWELSAPTTTATRFGIGSITKVMTGMVVDMLVSDGRRISTHPSPGISDRFPLGRRVGWRRSDTWLTIARGCRTV